MPDLWDTNPDSVFSLRGAEPYPAPSGHDDTNPAPSGHDDHTNEVRLKDERGRLRLPAYLLIALGVVVVAILLVVLGLLLAPG